MKGIKQPVIVFDFKDMRVYQAGDAPSEDMTKALTAALDAQKKTTLCVGSTPRPQASE
jgi:hypothetical protein